MFSRFFGTYSGRERVRVSEAGLSGAGDTLNVTAAERDLIKLSLDRYWPSGKRQSL